MDVKGAMSGESGDLPSAAPQPGQSSAMTDFFQILYTDVVQCGHVAHAYKTATAQKPSRA